MDIRKNFDHYIITDILGDGKFKAVPKKTYDLYQSPAINNRRTLLTKAKEIFDISQKTTTQQGILLTPEIKAKIRGEALPVKPASGRSLFKSNQK